MTTQSFSTDELVRVLRESIGVTVEDGDLEVTYSGPVENAHEALPWGVYSGHDDNGQPVWLVVTQGKSVAKPVRS